MFPKKEFSDSCGSHFKVALRSDKPSARFQEKNRRIRNKLYQTDKSESVYSYTPNQVIID